MRLPTAVRLSPVVLSVVLAIGCATADPSSGSPSAGPSSSPATPVQTPLPAPASKPRVRPVNSAARAVGFIDIRSVVPDAVVDLRYATADNFVGIRLYPANARCLVHESMRSGLQTAARALRSQGEVIVFWDCYRPHSVQQKMFEHTPNPAWVAAPGPYSRSHESGRSVDVSLARRQPNCPAARRVAAQCLIDMGTGFDSFTPQATAYATEGVSTAAQRNRARLRAAMSAGGLSVYSGEWWHFDGPGAGVQRPVIDVPLT